MNGKWDAKVGWEEGLFSWEGGGSLPHPPSRGEKEDSWGGGLSLSGQVDNRTLEGKEEVFLKGI